MELIILAAALAAAVLAGELARRPVAQLLTVGLLLVGAGAAVAGTEHRGAAVAAFTGLLVGHVAATIVARRGTAAVAARRADRQERP